MNNKEKAIEKLAGEFSSLDLTFRPYHEGGHSYRMSSWPGAPQEDIVVCVYRGSHISEPFHRQDFFFINYAYENAYYTQNREGGGLLRINRDECYIGQPYTGYALHAAEEVTIIGILIRKDAFFRDYLQALAGDAVLFRFFLDPQKDRFSDRFIHLSFNEDDSLRTLLEIMVGEYANRGDDTQAVLKPLVLAALMMLARKNRASHAPTEGLSLAEQIQRYLDTCPDTATLQSTAAHFGYHPNYISALLSKETGKTFSQFRLEKRMERAAILLRNTTLSIEEISDMLGYCNQSNFYKAFRQYYHKTPRQYVDDIRREEKVH
jgi:AraC-like DNA-binding protein